MNLLQTGVVRLGAATRSLGNFVVQSAPALAVRRRAMIRPKSLLILRLDAIGDYLLFRNFLPAIRRSRKYADYEITLLGSTAFKEIAEHFDGAYVDRFFWVDRERCHWECSYRFAVMQQLAAEGYEVIVNPRYSRDLVDTQIMWRVRAREKIGSAGDTSIISPWQKAITDGHFTRLIESPPGIVFEFERSRRFVEALLEEPCSLARPTIALGTAPALPIPQDHVLLFIGGSAAYKRWPIAPMAEVARHLRKHSKTTAIVLCGAPSDMRAAAEFSRSFAGDYLDLVGKTSLIELLHVVSRAKLVVTNETSVGHMAVACAVPHIVVLSNGTQYGRFCPYPANMAAGYRAVHPPEIEAMRDDHQGLMERYGEGSMLNINSIVPEEVISAIVQSGYGPA